MRILSRFHKPDFVTSAKWAGLVLIFLVSAITRILPPVTPVDSTVFDEAYFIPQAESYAVNRYYYDPHPPLGKMLLYFGLIAVNPDAANQIDAEKLANKVDDFKSPLDWRGVRLAPQILGSLVPVLIYLLTLELLSLTKFQRRAHQFIQVSIAGLIGLLAAVENTFILESRYALLTQIMMFFIVFTLWQGMLYAKARSFWRGEFFFLLTSIGMGLALSVKWLTLSILPAIFLLIIWKEWQIARRPKIRNFMILVLQRLVFLAAVVTTVYLSVFYWHFKQIQHYSPAADEVSTAYQEELQGGPVQVSFLNKFFEWHRLQAKYQEHVPALDYTKEDEIGSMWLTWPVMARPISFYWTTPGDNTYGFAYLIGNPVGWVISGLSILTLIAFAIGRVFGQNRLRLSHLWLLVLFLTNWLPFALIDRVMYIYHYVPALSIGFLGFGLILQELILHRGLQLARMQTFSPRINHMLRHFILPEWHLLVLAVLSLVVTIGFVYFSPFTYVRHLDLTQFQQRSFLKEWNMRWPGNPK